MHLQRIVMPTGKVSWTAFDDSGAVVPEIREFVLYLEARHYAPSTAKHYAKHVVRLGNYLGAFGKGFGALTAPEFDRFVKAVVRHGDRLDAEMALNIIPLRQEHVELSASLYNQILFAIKGFYQFLDMRLGSAVFGETDKHRGYDAPDTYRPFLHHISGRKARRNTERRADRKAKAAAAKTSSG